MARGRGVAEEQPARTRVAHGVFQRGTGRHHGVLLSTLTAGAGAARRLASRGKSARRTCAAHRVRPFGAGRGDAGAGRAGRTAQAARAVMGVPGSRQTKVSIHFNLVLVSRNRRLEITIPVGWALNTNN